MGKLINNGIMIKVDGDKCNHEGKPYRIGPDGRPGPYKKCHGHDIGRRLCNHKHKEPDKTTQRLNAIFGGIAGIFNSLNPLSNIMGNQNGFMNYMC